MITIEIQQFKIKHLNETITRTLFKYLQMEKNI